MTTDLIAAAKRSDMIALREALAKHPQIDAVDVQGWTALFHAAGRGDVAALRLLIDSGANVNHGIETGFTALFAAVLGQHKAVAQLLLESGAKVARMPGGGELRAHAEDQELKALLGSASS
ncbi:Ankyrin [Candidatus Koribacter versatilis Ellin345]|uniref:Ankyrin n=1 Tax=Koribacter versatilis (strain Ellin345) TaxID=204669 RepID=Q1IL18_KORVE|nr:ankyrin repeat domain-containing protein [Candidatus Koribacter versatilis]ABF42432.1 Ankyrin [Candidatus Koribacter versatilis Ellin345]